MQHENDIIFTTYWLDPYSVLFFCRIRQAPRINIQIFGKNKKKWNKFEILPEWEKKLVLNFIFELKQMGCIMRGDWRT